MRRDAGDGFGAFVRANQRFIAATADLSFEQVTSALTRARKQAFEQVVAEVARMQAPTASQK